MCVQSVLLYRAVRSEALVMNNAAQVTLNNFWVFLATIHNNIFERKKFIGFFTYYKVYPHFCLSGLFLVTLYSIFHKRTFLIRSY